MAEAVVSGILGFVFCADAVCAVFVYMKTRRAAGEKEGGG